LEQGGAIMSIFAGDLNLLAGQDPERINLSGRSAALVI